MRIVGGKLKGRALTSVGKGDMAAHLRPTTDRVRESIFNLLQNGGYGEPLDGARVLDLFAGTGALGLEALSRGASLAVFLDNGRKARALVSANIDLCKLSDIARFIAMDLSNLKPWKGPPFNLIFLDPPYGAGLGTRALLAVKNHGWLAKDALIVWEENARQTAPLGFSSLDARRYGDTWVNILRADAV
ncbi:MAG: 16S rRNA (guanine(966)-N(2))-methyltransferase RsmD [Alphaproteobacteria bacterium]|nr:16S rRNA (guanine(966)-N(2))-methyltransferase RsmD [Alphaproteobacteria bacterium]